MGGEATSFPLLGEIPRCLKTMGKYPPLLVSTSHKHPHCDIIFGVALLTNGTLSMQVHALLLEGKL